VWLRDTCKNELIKSPPPPPPYYDSCHDIHTQEGCTGGMCFWADGGCHSEVPPGVTGDKGFTGDQGEQGPRGEKGEAGDAGLGMEGVRQLLEMLETDVDNVEIKKGHTGDRGPQGDRGPRGDPGPAATAGTGYGLRYRMKDCSKAESDQFLQRCDSVDREDFECQNRRYTPNQKSCDEQKRHYESDPMNSENYRQCLANAAKKKGCCPTHLGSTFMRVYGREICK